MGRARHPGVRAGALRCRAQPGHCTGRHGDGAAPRAPRRPGGGPSDRPMTFDPGMPLAIELALFALAVIVLLAGTLGRPYVMVGPRSGPANTESYAGQVPRSGPATTGIGWLTFAGLVATFGLTFFSTEGASILRGSF